MECPRCGREESPVDRACHTPFCLYNGFEKTLEEDQMLGDFSLKSLRKECDVRKVFYSHDDTREVLGQRLHQMFVSREQIASLTLWRSRRSRTSSGTILLPKPSCGTCSGVSFSSNDMPCGFVPLKAMEDSLPLTTTKKKVKKKANVDVRQNSLFPSGKERRE